MINAGAGHFLRGGVEKAGEVVLAEAIRARPGHDVLPIPLGELDVHIRLQNLLRRHILHPKVAAVHSGEGNGRLGLL